MIKKKYLGIAKILLLAVLCFGMLFPVIPEVQANAAKKITNKSARKILKKKIKNKFCKYTFIDVDKDKIDELVVLGFSGKFTEGDDCEKTLTVYKVIGKKAKEMWSDAVEGDASHPYITFNLYYNGESFLTIHNWKDEYAIHTTYMLGSKKYKQVAQHWEYFNENEDYYYRSINECSEKEYNEYMEDILAGELDYSLESSSVKVNNKYFKKMLKSEFDYRCKLGEYDKTAVRTEYCDKDADGIDELLVWKDKTNVDVLASYNPSPLEGGYEGFYTRILSFVAKNSEFDYDEGQDYCENDESDGGLSNEEIAEKALAAVKNYCIEQNPNLNEFLESGEYDVYWRILSDSEDEIVILFKSYTRAQNYFYINPDTGDTYITVFVPMISDAEEPTNERLNIWDYL